MGKTDFSYFGKHLTKKIRIFKSALDPSAPFIPPRAWPVLKLQWVKGKEKKAGSLQRLKSGGHDGVSQC
jgi:hypothetical protein